MKMKILLLGVLGAVLALNLCAVAQSGDQVLFQGQLFCVGQEDCRDFASWGLSTPPGYVVLYESDGHTISDYLWIDPTNGFLMFESNDGQGFALLPPSDLLFYGGFIEDGTLQQVNQLFPGGGPGRSLFIESAVDTPEPSTLLMFGPAAVFLFSRARRFLRS